MELYIRIFVVNFILDLAYHVTRVKYLSVQTFFSGCEDSTSTVTAGNTEMVWTNVRKTTVQ